MLKLLPACILLLAGVAPAAAQMLTAAMEGALNRTVRTAFRPADAAAHRVLEGRDARSRWVVLHWTVQPGQSYTLDIRYPRLGASYCMMVVDGDPFRLPYQGAFFGSTCGGWFMEGRAPGKPMHVAKYLVRIAPDSPGTDIYFIFSYYPRAEETVAEPEAEITLRSPADPGVEQEAPMPGWESQGPTRYYNEWSRAPLRLNRYTPAPAPAPPPQATGVIDGELNRKYLLPVRAFDSKYRALEIRQPTDRFLVFRWKLQPGQEYTLDCRYPKLGASYCLAMRDGNPLDEKGNFLGSTCGGWFMEGRAPDKPKHVEKYRVRIAPDSAGRDLYMVFAYRPRPEEKVAEPEMEIMLRSPADPGVGQETPMPGWESLGPSRFYNDWSREPMRLAP